MKAKNVLIFGCSGQIGRSIVRKLTKDNYTVTAVTRNIHQKGTEDAVRMTAACKAVICDGANLEEALAIYNGQ